MKILRTTDIVTLKHEGLEVDISPLTHGQSTELSALSYIENGETKVNANQQAFMLLKFCLKEIRGLEGFDGEAITLKHPFNDNDLSDAMNALSKVKLAAPISFISYTGSLSRYDGIEIMVNGKEVKLGND